ncbi:glycosylase [Corynebacterium hindlerae]|uniref:Glycosylase n=1 Tax=Corynebacterium hindlerae TaxID=699041 RepID=A0A7G5FHN5_9CORY|nr:alpha-amylase family glycosyl hydrolase [Corynebacterium hindlerae]QMV86126.1 glycosylase [Corynebacterium hindlerae]
MTQSNQWVESAVFYQIYPASFADSNSDGIGDLRGIVTHLDYLSSLGITGIWLNPCFASPFKDGGYDVADYYSVAPRYGTNDDLIALFSAAHERGIKVILDLVPSHTSEQHPWFTLSSEATPNAYSDRYIWTSHAFDHGDGMPFIGGETPRDATYILNFFKSQPALNYGFAEITRPWQQPIDAPGPLANRRAMADVLKYWLARGADGFRVDMADSLVKNDGTDKTTTITVWQNILAEVKAEFPDAFFVSEWGKPWQAVEAGFDADFYLDWRGNGYNHLVRNTDTALDRVNDLSFFNSDSESTAQEFLDCYLPQLAQIQGRGFFSLISGNHDCPRLAPRLNEAERKLFFTFLLTMPGVPFIYYGDEIGMTYRQLPTHEGGYARTGSRTPMQWDSDKLNFGFSDVATDLLYLPVGDDPAVSVTSQEGANGTMLETVRSLIGLRQQHPALGASANVEFCSEDGHDEPHPKLLSFLRSTADETLLVVINLHHHVVKHPIVSGAERPIFSTGELPEIGEFSVAVPALTAVILSSSQGKDRS